MSSFYRFFNKKYRYKKLWHFTLISAGVPSIFSYLNYDHNKHNKINYFGWCSFLEPPILCKVKEDNFIDIDEVKKHGKQSTNGFWTVYKNKVYDITEFVDVHPGGDIIMEAVGGYLDPYFIKYKFHDQPEVLEYLDSMFIGCINEQHIYENTEKILDKQQQPDDYQHEPIRSPLLKVVSEKPFNAETPVELLDQQFLTNPDLFYARSHHPIPSLDKRYYTLEVCYEKEFIDKNKLLINPQYYSMIDHRGRACNCRVYTLEELKSVFTPHKITATLQCAGNRRKEMNQIEPVKGLQWDGGAIGNALWNGYRVREILTHDDILKDDNNQINNNHIAGHLIMRGADKESSSTEQYETSIPLNKAFDSDTLVAVSMNGEELPKEHGYPARMVVPGVCGARSVKWLQSLTVSEIESEARWQKQDYKVLPSSIKFGDKVDMSEFSAIQGTPITSFICNPKNESLVKMPLTDNNITISGYAYSGNGNAIKSVEVSIDGGDSWIPAQMNSICDNKWDNRCWSWTLWNVTANVSDSSEEIDIVVRSIDSSNNTQPHTPEDVWNMRGLLNNARNHSHVYIERVI